MKQKAFTLVELLVVIAIIGLIATLSVIALGNARQKSRDSKRVADIKQVQTALELFFSDQGRYPTTAEWNTGSLAIAGSMGTTTYLAVIPKDPQTGINLAYSSLGAGDSYAIYSNLENTTGTLSPGILQAGPSGLKNIGSSEGLTAFYRFDQGSGSTLLDLTGRGNDGTLRNNPTWAVASSSCLYGTNCMLFDGQNDYVDLGDKDDFNMGSGDYTMMAWAKFNSLTVSQRIFDKSQGSGWYSLWKHTTNIYFNYGGSWGTGQWACGTPVQGQWIHILQTVKRGTTACIYINGALCSCSGQANTTNYSGSGVAHIGCYGNDCGSYDYAQQFDGYLQDLRIYKKYFTATDATAMYNATKP